MTGEPVALARPGRPVRIELPARTVGALLLVAAILWLLIRLWPVLLAVVGALLALPVAATLMMLVEELRVELPGEQEGPLDTSLREGDDRAEEECERRTHGVGAKQAAGIAAEISRERRTEESLPRQPANGQVSSEYSE